MNILAMMIVAFGPGAFSGYATTIPFQSARACGDAIPAMKEMIEDHFPAASIHCVEYATSVRPKPRPE